jgi:hypothetical protein
MPECGISATPLPGGNLEPNTVPLEAEMKRVLFICVFLATAALSLAQGHGGSRFMFGATDGGSMVQLLLRDDVLKELAVTDDQKSKINALESRLDAQVVADFEKLQKDNVGDPDTMRGAISSTGDKFAKELPDILTADQFKRLRQLLIQKTGYSTLGRKDIQEELGFSDEQRQKVKDAQRALLDAFDGLMGEPAEKRMSIVKDAREAHQKTLKEILTADQFAKFDEMKGKPFIFEATKKGMS